MRRRAAATLLVTLAAATARGEVVLTPPSLRLGGEERVRVSWSRNAAHVRWRASLGRVIDGIYDPGPRRAPGHVVIAALAPDGAFLGAAVLRLVGKGTLPTHTSPRASVSVEVAGERFGPVAADGYGDAAVPVVVPPEVTTATVVSVDIDGLSTRRTVDLPMTPAPRGLLLAPERLAAGDSAIVTVLALGDSGAWRDPSAAPPEATVRGAATLDPFRAVAPGRWEAPLRVERLPTPHTIDLDVHFDDQSLAAQLDVAAWIPPPTPPPLDVLVAARTGAATAFGGLWSFLAGAEIGLARGDLLAGALELTVARGNQQSLLQLSAALAARLRLPLAPRARLELAAGLGLARAAIDSGHDVAPFLFAATGLALATGPGELLLEVRYSDLRYDLDVTENTLGLSLTAGYRLRL